MVSVHDNKVYGQAVDYEAGRVILYTVYPIADPVEYTDIVFTGVIAYHIEHEAFQGSGVSANILFDAEEGESKFALARYGDMLAAAKNHGWPVLEYDSLEDLASQLIATGAKCFEIYSSCGLCGFVFAASMEFRQRSSRACVAGD